jgi:hypothetical protein
MFQIPYTAVSIPIKAVISELPDDQRVLANLELKLGEYSSSGPSQLLLTISGEQIRSDVSGDAGRAARCKRG